MSFKSTIDWPTQPDNLPTYDGGDPGKSAVRVAKEQVGGIHGIRSVEWDDLDGTRYEMNTRNGFPEVVATSRTGAVIGVISGKRGWLARIVDAVVAALFSPYSILVESRAYTPVRTGYTVLPFITAYNVTPPDLMQWGDVISFSSSGLLVNGKPMPALGIVGHIPTSKALPWLIPAYGAGLAQYGTTEINDEIKRVFSVTRTEVHSWEDVPDSVLGGSAYRIGDKALVCGQRIEASTHKAFLSQLSFTGSAWNSFTSGWYIHTAEIAMTLTEPYLTQTAQEGSADFGSVGLALGTAESGTSSSTTTAPETEFGPTASIGELFSPGDYFAKIRWTWNGKLMYAFQSELQDAYSKTVYSGTSSASGYLAGYAYSVSASNIKKFGSHTETRHNVLQTPSIPPTDPQVSSIGPTCSGPPDAVTITWNDVYATPKPRGRSGESVRYYYGGCSGSADYDSEEQVGDFGITVDGVETLSVHLSRYKETGNTLTMHGTTNDLDPFLGTYSGSFSGFGAYSYLDIATDAWYYYAPSQRVLISEAIYDKANEWIGTTVYDFPWSPGSGIGGSDLHQYYTGTVDPKTPLDTMVLLWSTKDFILYDSPNGVFISIEGTFTGSQYYGGTGTGHTKVELKIVTPMGSYTETLYEVTNSYADLLEEIDIGSGVMAVPSPNLRLMFTPLFQEQGDFKGGVYTAQSEISNGAAPAYLFNFVLKLDTFSAIGTDYEDAAEIHFIPCNLIEMLYAYVFSTKAGVDPTDRYPVEYSARYTAFMDNLFDPTRRINFRNGASVDWLDSLGGDYETETTTELYRV